MRGLAPILNGMGQIPIERGKGDKEALARAIETLRAGACIGVFPEGTRSRGKVLRARSGVGRLALEVPEAHVTLVAIEGTSDLTGFPRRPRIRVRFFDPAGGQPRPDEDPGELSARLLAEIRELVPPSISYRKRAKLSGSPKTEAARVPWFLSVAERPKEPRNASYPFRARLIRVTTPSRSPCICSQVTRITR